MSDSVNYSIYFRFDGDFHSAKYVMLVNELHKDLTIEVSPNRNLSLEKIGLSKKKAKSLNLGTQGFQDLINNPEIVMLSLRAVISVSELCIEIIKLFTSNKMDDQAAMVIEDGNNNSVEILKSDSEHEKNVKLEILKTEK